MSIEQVYVQNNVADLFTMSILSYILYRICKLAFYVSSLTSPLDVREYRNRQLLDPDTLVPSFGPRRERTPAGPFSFATPGA